MTRTWTILWLILPVAMIGCAEYVSSMGDDPGDDDPGDDDTGDDDTGDDDTGDDDTGDDDTGDDDTTASFEGTCELTGIQPCEALTVIATGTAYGAVPFQCFLYRQDACGDDDGTPGPTHVFHGAATETAVDVYVDGVLTPELAGVEPLQGVVSSQEPGQLFEDGVHQIDVYPAGSDPKITPPLAGNFVGEWTGQHAYHVVLSGAPGDRRLNRFIAYGGVPPQDNWALSLQHAVEDLPEMDVLLQPSDVPLYGDVLLGHNTNTWKIPVGAGAFSLDFSPAD